MALLNAAIIGCGDMGRMHAQCLQQIDGVNPYAFCDTDLSRAQSLQRQYGGRYAAADPEKVIRDDQVDVVYIATHTASHAHLCAMAARAGKHLLIEKPVALTAMEAWRMDEVVQQNGIKAMVGMKFRFYTMAQKIRRMIPSPYTISVQVTDDPWPADFWANDPLLGGGHVISQGVHGTDLLHFLAGSEPQSVFAAGANYHQPTRVMDHLSAVFRFANNTAGAFLATDSGRPPGIGKFLVQVFGKEGSAVLADRLTRLSFRDPQTGRQIEYNGDEDGFMEENRAFVRWLHGETVAVPSVRDGCIAQAMIDTAIRSAHEGVALPINLFPDKGRPDGVRQ